MCLKPKLVQVDIPQKDKISSFMHEFFEKVMDVTDDGHCGSCAAVGLRDMFVEDVMNL